MILIVYTVIIVIILIQPFSTNHNFNWPRGLARQGTSRGKLRYKLPYEVNPGLCFMASFGEADAVTRAFILRREKVSFMHIGTAGN
jgi:hypothetical protein